jgi:hypothetical protein
MLSTGTFLDRLKYLSYTKKSGQKHKSSITGQFHYFLYFQKFLKKVLYKSLFYHLTLDNILVKEQFGFRCNSSTETAIYTLINNIIISVTEK